MIPVKVARLSLSNKGPVVLLRGITDKRTLPIFIGTPEAQAIAIRMEGISVPRPLTHDLMLNLLESLGAALKRVEISELADNTFFACLIINFNDKESIVDSRPSDAIAMAIRCEAPIFVAPSVMQQAGVLFQEPAAGDGSGKSAVPDNRSESEKLKQKLAKAVEKENYEEAARLRDRIKELGEGRDSN